MLCLYVKQKYIVETPTHEVCMDVCFCTFIETDTSKVMGS